jgi:hypothetical protein
LTTPEPTIKDGNYDSDPAGWARYTDSRRTLALLTDPPTEAGT